VEGDRVNAPRVLLSGLALAQPMGGVVRHAREILPRAARQLAERGGSLAILEGRGGLPFAESEMIERLACPIPAGPVLVRASLESGWLHRMLARASAEGRAFDLVHTAHLPVPRALPLPYVLLLHDLKVLHAPEIPLARRLVGAGVVGRAVRNAAMVIAVSEALRAEVLELPGTEAERVRVVPNAADHLQFLERASIPNAPLVHVGHVERRKNLELLVRALAHDRSLPRLVLAGAPKRSEDVRLRDLAARLGVSARVEFLGLVDDVALARLYARAACAVFPSWREGFGIPALEARAAGVPVAISNSPALLEVTGSGTPTFAPDDPAACAAAVRAAIATPASDLAAATARARAYHWDDSAARLVDAWCAAVSSSARA
jgi:glycosyltransferase involved in cell wall biosynthesis